MIRQLATLLGSGLTVEDSLNALIKQAESLSTQAVSDRNTFLSVRRAITCRCNGFIS